MLERVPLRYIAKRSVYFVVVVWLAATINFVLPRIVGHDPILAHLTEMSASVGNRQAQGPNALEQYREWAGLNQPLFTQYVNFLRNMVRMDFGYSFSRHRPVWDVVGYALPWTLGLLGTTTILSFILGTFLGSLAAWRRSNTMLNVAVSTLMALSVIPAFVIGLVLADVLAFRLKLFPLAGLYTPGRPADLLDFAFWLDVIYHAALPALSLLLSTTGTWAMGMRGLMITVLGSDYIRFAEAKGIRRLRLLVSYAIRNVMLPQATLLAISLGTLVTSVTIVEAVFGYPGLGSVLERAVQARDYNLIQGCVFFLIVAIAIATFIIDLSYPLLDPRIRYEN